MGLSFWFGLFLQDTSCAAMCIFMPQTLQPSTMDLECVLEIQEVGVAEAFDL